MFTGIIEAAGRITQLHRDGSNLELSVSGPLAAALKIDQSLAHNGVCLTVVGIDGDTHRVTAVAETLQKSCLDDLRIGDRVNLERALRVGDRLDGHFVQGHVDTVGQCIGRQELEGSWLFRFAYPAQFRKLLVEKGSICVNGVSLTAFGCHDAEFTVTIIPYTYEHTGFHDLQPGQRVNLEFDMLGKYILRSLEKE
jgi:riboflavin synthase